MESTRTAYLERYFDPELELPKLAKADISASQIVRLSRALAVTLYAAEIPRRLGGDATSEDLAIDKKRARRVAHALNQSMRGWQKKKPTVPPDPELRVEGAQLLWPAWVEAHLVETNNQIRLAVTWAIRSDEPLWGRQAVVKFENEINWMTYALRD